MADVDLIAKVEQSLNNPNVEIIIEDVDGFAPLESFKCNVVKRLFVEYKNNIAWGNHFEKDFAIALRQFLLVFNARIDLPSYKKDWEKLGIFRDEETGKVYCKFDLPKYLDEDLVKSAFMNDVEVQKAVTDDNLITDPLLYKTFGIAYYRSLAQKLSVFGAANTPDGYTTLVCLPTGGGKSTITHAVSFLHEKLTIVIVPTVSLAIDQARVAKERLRKASDKSINISEQIFEYHSGSDLNAIISAIKNRTARLLFISPEAVTKNSAFVEAIDNASKTKYFDNLIIDEAHMVVDWGDSFRVDYQCLEPWRKRLIKKNPSLKTFLLSATFEDRSVKLLKQLFSEDGKWIEIRCDELRKEPRFINVFAFYPWDKKNKIVELIYKLPHPMIVYVQSPEEADELEVLLKQNGIKNIAKFTGKTPNDMREKLIAAWSDNKFETMIATSAFGIGVDKPDVRTVLHTYMPSNANSFYQELGRGGRDGLSCLSVTCLDVDYDFNRAINKKIITPEKLIPRWFAMYNSGKRTGNNIYLDTSAKPKYMGKNVLDDDLNSEKNVNWNIHCLLFMRRNELIKINDVTYDHNSCNYCFSIEILDDRLRDNNDELLDFLTKVREKEKKYHSNSLITMKENLRNTKECISEMFNETYSLTNEYCAGCRSHKNINRSTSEFPLKYKLYVNRCNNTNLEEKVIIRNDKPRCDVFSDLIRNGVDVLITDRDCKELIQQCDSLKSVLILRHSTFYDLIEKGHSYFLGNSIAFEFDESPNVAYKQLHHYLLKVQKKYTGKVYHILDKNLIFEEIDKSFSDFISL